MTQFNPNPILYPPIAQPEYGQVQAQITNGASAVDVKIAELKLAFFDELQKYVDQTDNEGVETLTDNLQTILSDLNSLNVAMLVLLTNPTDYDSAYTSTVLTSLASTIQTNLDDTTTGLTDAAKNAIWDKGRAKINFAATRAVRRINAIESARLPYSGAVTDAILEHDQDTVWALADLNHGITMKEAEMTYDFQRKKIAEAMANEQLKMGDHHVNLSRKLDAYTKYDTMSLQNHWNYYEYLMKKYLAFINGAKQYILEIVSGGEQITFENWKAMSELLMKSHFAMTALVSDISGSV